MNENLKFWEIGREVPNTAKRKITGGNLAQAGFSDINPVWRIKKLTEMFGMAGFGWFYKTVDTKFQNGVDGEVFVFITINLFVKVNDEWSQAIEGQGGNSFTSKTKNGLKNSDEAIKMATTDAISVACKMLGIGADVYFEKDVRFETKYDKRNDEKIENKKEIEKEVEAKEIKKETDDKTLRLRIGKMLIEMEGDKEKALLKLTEITTFESNGKLIKGVDSLDRLKENRLKTTYGKIKQLYELWKKNNEERSFDV